MTDLGANTRLIAVLAADYVVRWLQLRASHFGDITTAVVFATVSRANTAHLDRRPETARAWGALETPPTDDLRRPVTAYAAAAALGLPRETLRRRIKALGALGYLDETPEGMFIPARFMTTQGVMNDMRNTTILSRDFCLALRRAGLGPTPPRTPDGAVPEPPLHRAISRATNAFCLRVLEDVTRLAGGDLMLALVTCALNDANLRHLAEEPGAPLLRPAAPLPESLRRPVAARALAKVLGLPAETTRRHLHRLIERRMCATVRGGFISIQDRIDWPTVAALFERTTANARQLEVTLTGLGIWNSDPAPERQTRPG